MLCINNCHHQLESGSDDEQEEEEPDDENENEIKNQVQFLENELTTSRIRSGLSKLECLIIDNIGKSENDFWRLVSIHVLNSISQQIKSLHINDRIEDSGLNKWEFIKREYPCTKIDKDEFWFPLNVEELCLCSTTDDIDDFDNDEELLHYNFQYIGSHLWHFVDSILFPKLKRLKIVNVLDESNNARFTQNGSNQNANINPIVSNIKSLISNGLESLEFVFTHLEYKDIAPLFDENDRFETFHRQRLFVSKLLNVILNMFKMDIKFKNKKKNIILKIELNIVLPTPTWRVIRMYSTIKKQ